MAPLTSAALPRTDAVAARLELPERVGSTNADLLAAVRADADAWPHLSVLVTDDQTAGRGRLGRTWTAPAGSALAISVRLDVARLPVASRGWIPLVAGTALTRAVQSEGADAQLKWPNDVLVGGRKICGILTEAVAGLDGAVVVGAGINTAMTAEQLPVDTATSFAVLGIDPDVDGLLSRYLVALRTLCDELVDEPDAARAAVRSACGTIGRDVTVQLPDASTLRGSAEGLDDEGRLLVRSGADLHTVSAGDVVHVR